MKTRVVEIYDPKDGATIFRVDRKFLFVWIRVRYTARRGDAHSVAREVAARGTRIRKKLDHTYQ